MSNYKITSPTFGSDFELVPINKYGTPISVEGLLGGTKEDPFPLTDTDDGCYRQEDNVNAEFNIPPVINGDDWDKYIDHCITHGTAIIQANDPSVSELAPLSSVDFDEALLKTDQASQFGCEPSIDAYTGEERRPSEEDASNTMRTCGFHVHMGTVVHDGTQKIKDADKLRFGRLCDLHLGLPSILIDSDTRRRKLYGKAGDIRTKDILNWDDESGNSDICVVEYRSLSGVFAKPSLRRWVFEQVQKVIQAFNDNQDVEHIQETQDAINGSHVTVAKTILSNIGYSGKDIEKIEMLANA